MATPFDQVLDRIDFQPLPAPDSVEDDLPYATHSGILKLGEASIKVFVLSNGRRVIDERDLRAFLGV